MIQIESLDHLVLTVADLQRSIDFYTQILGMQELLSAITAKRYCSANKKSTCT